MGMKVPILNLSKTAKARLAVVARWLEKGAPHVSDKGIAGFDANKGVEFTPCGTVCCIAGALVQFSTTPMEEAADCSEYSDEAPWPLVSERAARLLGVEFDFAVEELFLDGFVERRGITPAVAARCIRHVIKTGEVDWERAKEAT